MVDIQSVAAEIRRGKKRRRRKKEERNYRMKILWSALLHRATIIRTETGKQHGLTANGPEFNLCDNAPPIECGT